ncbi:hypothetical protein [Proteiniphilum sp.]|uniref:hypothetical protein n=1 Tax=Proteiniphilum sp. TaxID=1926877 RepID=UPI002B21548E|nr:hypothetical protein [Proteiniphilum sp.]MEA4916951.1 hypothetical protein [Proteiniphilum sp.]
MKKIFLSFMMFAVMLSSMVLTSCGNDDTDKVDDRELVHKLADEGVLLGKLKDKLELKAGKEYALTGNFIIEENGELHIPGGTVIKANEGFGNYILVLQGGKIFVNGTAQAPVTMTANTANASQGHWGGLIINGRAPLAGGTTGTTEINTEYKYGGTNVADNSGSITYLKLEYTGARSSADVEHNGLTLNGVGNGTKIENIFIPDGADDGIEFFGGSVNVKNLLVVNSDDDMFDFTQGYTGTLENAYGVWESDYSSSESDPRGVEADGNLDGKFPDHTGQSDFTIKNMTIELKLAALTDKNHADFKKKTMQDVILIRRGAKATIQNALVKGTGTAQDVIDLNGANTGTAISLTNQLTSVTDKAINPETGFPNVKIETGNAGCSSNLFSWTGYEF